MSYPYIVMSYHCVVMYFPYKGVSYIFYTFTLLQLKNFLYGTIAIFYHPSALQFAATLSLVVVSTVSRPSTLDFMLIII